MWWGVRGVTLQRQFKCCKLAENNSLTVTKLLTEMPHVMSSSRCVPSVTNKSEFKQVKSPLLQRLGYLQITSSGVNLPSEV